MKTGIRVCMMVALAAGVAHAADWWKPYSAPCVEREDVFAFAEKPSVKLAGKDRFEISFAVTGSCDVTVGIIDPARDLTGEGRGTVVRHLASGVLGPNAPEPFAKNSLKQTIVWNGKNDLGFYVKEPGKLRVRVSLGLKATFDKRLGSTSPHNMPGVVLGIGADRDGVYVISYGHKGRPFVRAFDHDGNYRHSVTPPPANLPESKLQGMGYVEYEPGKKALHSPDAYHTVAHNGVYLPLHDGMANPFRPAVVNSRIYYCNKAYLVPSILHYFYTDGGTDLAGMADRIFIDEKCRGFRSPRFAASPDGKWIYMTDREGKNLGNHVVWRIEAGGTEPASPFIGTLRKPGSDNQSLCGPSDIACDAKGRVYVSDTYNRRVQVFSPEGKHLHTIPVEAPGNIGVHEKTGAIYVMHQTWIRGKTTPRLTKFSAFPETKELFHVDGIYCRTMTLDSWSAKPRIWMVGAQNAVKDPNARYSVRVWEEQGRDFTLAVDFDKKALKHDGDHYLWWPGSIRNKTVCHPVQEDVYLSCMKGGAFRFDIPSGKLLEFTLFTGYVDDIAFDKRGYMHAHYNPGFDQAGVGRFDPDRDVIKSDDSRFSHLPHIKVVRYREVPYDYGILGRKGQRQGVLPTKCQPGAKFFQDGIGVNMMGDVAVESNIYYSPKGFDISEKGALGVANALPAGSGRDTERNKYALMRKLFIEAQRRGDDYYFIRRQPGVTTGEGTVWTYDRTGELRDECAVITGKLINGVQIDEDGKLYFTATRPRLLDGKVFLAGRQGVFGGERGRHPYMGTYMKSARRKVRLLYGRASGYAPIPLDQKPDRPAEVADGPARSKDGTPGIGCWMEGTEWLYAGASPIVTNQPCSCYTMRNGLDWYKRSYALESYRHSIAVLDTNGNVIMRVGRFGNLDSGDGPKSAIPVGDDGIAMSFVEYVSATDNYMCFDDNGERLVVLTLGYHAEETTPIETAIAME